MYSEKKTSLSYTLPRYNVVHKIRATYIEARYSRRPTAGVVLVNL